MSIFAAMFSKGTYTLFGDVKLKFITAAGFRHWLEGEYELSPNNAEFAVNHVERQECVNLSEYIKEEFPSHPHRLRPYHVVLSEADKRRLKERLDSYKSKPREKKSDSISISLCWKEEKFDWALDFEDLGPLINQLVASFAGWQAK